MESGFNSPVCLKSQGISKMKFQDEEGDAYEVIEGTGTKSKSLGASQRR